MFLWQPRGTSYWQIRLVLHSFSIRFLNKCKLTKIVSHVVMELFFRYTVLPAHTLVEAANMKMENLKTIAMAMIVGGAIGGVAGTLEGATLLGMVIGAEAGAAELACLESGMSYALLTQYEILQG